MTVVRVFFKTNVTVNAVTVSVVKTNVFSTLEGIWVRIYAYLYYMAGPGLNFGGPKRGRAWKILKNGPGRAKKSTGRAGPRFFGPCRGLTTITSSSIVYTGCLLYKHGPIRLYVTAWVHSCTMAVT